MGKVSAAAGHESTRPKRLSTPRRDISARGDCGGLPTAQAERQHTTRGEDRGGIRAADTARVDRGVEILEPADPCELASDETLIGVKVRFANWDELVRTGSFDVGLRPPMALGAQGAGAIRAVGDGVKGLNVVGA